MRKLFYFGLFLMTFGVVGSVQAQPHRRGHEDVRVVVAGHGHAKHHKKGRVYRSNPPHRRPVPAIDHRARDERRDLWEIVDISEAWRLSISSHNHHGMARADRRLDAWIARELREARHSPYERYHARRVRELGQELDALSWRFASGRARRPHYERKSRILAELVALSERQVRYASTRYPFPMRLSLAIR